MFFCKIINLFFIDKIKRLRQRIPMVELDPLDYIRAAMSGRSSSFKLKPLNLNEVEKIIKNLKNSTATGIDFIDTRTLKFGVTVLAPAIQHIINLSIETSVFPNIWKVHKVTPLLKNADCDKLLPKSYRPVVLKLVFITWIEEK